MKKPIRMAQASIVGLGMDIVVDGINGAKTRAAYSKLTPQQKEIVKQTVFLVDDKFDMTRLDRKKAADATYTGPVPSERVRVAISGAAQLLGLDEATLMAFASLESSFNPEAVRNSYRGLMQMGEPAWDAASKFLSDRKIALAPYTSWKDPAANALAGAAYSIINENAVRKLGYNGKWNPAAMYLAHQQGATGFVELYKASRTGETVSASRIRGMSNNPPPDGDGVTYDPRAFVSRWTQVTDERVAQYSV